MKSFDTDILIVGAGPVGLISAYLAQQCGLKTIIVDKSGGPLEVGRADALNARTLQLLELAGLFDELYPLGKPCNTSSVWADGKFISRQSSWWDKLEGCFHKHFLMLGQSFVEKLIDKKLKDMGAAVQRQMGVESVEVTADGCMSRLTNGRMIHSKYVIGSDGSRSTIRIQLNIPFEIVRPQIVWAVIDGVIETDFPKTPEIIVFQAETSDVAWIPREGEIDRFYVRMDTKDFEMEEAIEKINRAMSPHKLNFKEIAWFSQFSVKESVAERFSFKNRIFLAGDSCHIHSVNGGQGLNTGLADAFNLIWKINQVDQHGADASLLSSYEGERKPVAQSVIETSGELVRTTKYSSSGTHAQDYVKVVEKRSGNVTGMGIRYGEEGLVGQRLYDFMVRENSSETRVYSMLDYSKYTLIKFGNGEVHCELPPNIQVLSVTIGDEGKGPWTSIKDYSNIALLVRPDSYIEAVYSLEPIQ